MEQIFIQYVRSLHSYIHDMEQRLHELEREIKNLAAELENAKSRPPVHVDRIEYKFDQLKVETLEGTLNIGLNPSEMGNMDEFHVGNENSFAPFSPEIRMEKSIEIENSIIEYLHTELEDIVKQYGSQYKLNIDDSHIDFIIEDIKKQLPDRIEYYLRNAPIMSDSPEADRHITETIISQMKQDIEKAVDYFLQNFPKGMRED